MGYRKFRILKGNLNARWQNRLLQKKNYIRTFYIENGRFKSAKGVTI